MEVISPVTFKLDLPKDIQVYPVFHSSLLKSYQKNNLPGRSETSPYPIRVGKEQEWEVDEILAHQRKNNRLEYLVKWTGFQDHDSTWEKEDNLSNANKLVSKYWNQLSRKESS